MDIEFAFYLIVGGIFLARFLLNALSDRAKKIFGIAIAGALVTAVTITAVNRWWENTNSNPFDYVRITEVDYKAVVVDESGGYGKAEITERLTFDIHAAGSGPDSLFWELWRDLPESRTDGVLVNYYVKSVKEIKPDGTAVPWEQSEKLYWDDWEFTKAGAEAGYGPGKWFHSQGPYNPDARQYECLLFYVDGLYREKITFEIEYVMFNAALRYGDYSELYLAMWSDWAVRHLESFKAQILFPLDKMPREGNYVAYTYGTNSHEFPFEESTAKNPGYHTFSFELDKSQLKFRPYNMYIEFALFSFGEDKHIFTQYASENNYFYNDDMLYLSRWAQEEYEALPGQYFRYKITVFICLLAGAALLVWIVSGTDRRMREKYTFYKPEYDIEYFRDIPGNLDPIFAASLVYCKHKMSTDTADDGYSAVMLSLARKGYIELERIRIDKGWESDNMKIIVKYKSMLQQPPEAPPQTDITEPLSPTEALYFNLIVRHSYGQEIALPAFQLKVKNDYEYTSSFVKNVKNTINNMGLSGGYFFKEYRKPNKNVKAMAVFLGIAGALIVLIGNIASYQTRMDLAFGAYFILGGSFIGSAVFLWKIAGRYFLLTPSGETEYAKWRGLYNFLNSDTLMNERTVPDLVIWEQYLVYATAFGISEKVIKALEIRCTEMGLNLNNSRVLRNPYYRSRYFYHSHGGYGRRTFGSSFGGATRSAVSHSVRSGGHGGYGGGGRGGGGGGGGH